MSGKADWRNYILTEQALKNRCRTFQFGPFIKALHRLYAELGRPPSILDCGCACGHVSKMLSLENIPHQYTGLDFDKSLLDLGRIHYGLTAFIQGDIRTMPFEDASFDVVVAYDVLYLFEHQEVPLAELYRVASRLLVAETHLAPCGSNSLKMRMHSNQEYTSLPNLTYAPELYGAVNVPEPDWTLHWEVPSTYFKYLGIPYRLRTLSFWDKQQGGRA